MNYDNCAKTLCQIFTVFRLIKLVTYKRSEYYTREHGCKYPSGDPGL